MITYLEQFQSINKEKESVKNLQISEEKSIYLLLNNRDYVVGIE